MVFAGLAGSGVLHVITSVGSLNDLKPNTQLMDHFIAPIPAFVVILVIGLLAGGIMF
jgi:hypothetical protein